MPWCEPCVLRVPRAACWGGASWLFRTNGARYLTLKRGLGFEGMHCLGEVLLMCVCLDVCVCSFVCCVRCRWLRNFLDLECFVLSGMTAKDTICAGVAGYYRGVKQGGRGAKGGWSEGRWEDLDRWGRRRWAAEGGKNL